jgi:hypothetical protein
MGNKRKRPMIIGDVDSAHVVTPKTIHVTKKDGTVVTKHVWEPLYPHVSNVEKPSERPEMSFGYDAGEPPDIGSPQPERTKTYRVRLIFR